MKTMNEIDQRMQVNETMKVRKKDYRAIKNQVGDKLILFTFFNHYLYMCCYLFIVDVYCCLRCKDFTEGTSC